MITKNIFPLGLFLFFTENYVNSALPDSQENVVSSSQHNESENSTQILTPESAPLTKFIIKEAPLFGQLHTLHNLTLWATVEELLAAIFRWRLQLLETEADLMKRFLKDYDESTGKAVKNAHKPNPSMKERGRIVGSSIVLGHRMTSRFSGVTKQLREFLGSEEYKGFSEDIKTVLMIKPVVSNEGNDDTFSDTQPPPIIDKPLELKLGRDSSKSIFIHRNWPGWQDMFMSMNSFITLQEVNGMSPESLAEGLAIDTSAAGFLNARQCSEIGIFTLGRLRFYMAVEWFTLALERAQTESKTGNETISVDLVKSLHNLAVQEHNRVWVEAGSWNRNRSPFELYTELITEDLVMDEEPLTSYRQAMYFEARGIEGPNRWSVAQHIDVCIGFTRQTPKMQINLKCYYEKKRHPYLYINPVKVEMLSENPPVWQFYEMLGNETIDRIKNYAVDRLRISSLVGIAPVDIYNTTDYRSSVGTGMDYREIPKAYKLAEMVSGLKVINASEPTQIVEYVYGRHYITHSDTYDNETEASDTVRDFGDRVATMLYYLEVPDLGGSTSFCRAGLGAHHVRGSAILWFNMYRNGTSRKDVEHGACPVMHGHKLAANHWITYHDNWRHYKCSKNQYE